MLSQDKMLKYSANDGHPISCFKSFIEKTLWLLSLYSICVAWILMSVMIINVCVCIPLC